MAGLSEKDQKELEKIRAVEELLQHKSSVKVVPFSDEDKLKFHYYLKDLAQALLGNEVDLNQENLAFLLLDVKSPNAAFVSYKDENKNFIYVTAGLFETCDNKDQFSFVIAHELGHFLEYKKHGRRINTKGEETYADLDAIPKMARAGFNIEQASVFANKLFTGNNYNLLDEHFSDPGRRTLLDMRIMAERDSLRKQGNGRDDVVGDKTHPWEEDFLSFVRGHPKIQHKKEVENYTYPASAHELHLFFIGNEYKNATYEKKVDMWFDKVQSRLRVKTSQHRDEYIWLSDEDVTILQRECDILYFQKKKMQKSNFWHEKKNYYFEKKYLDFILNEPTLDLATSKSEMMVDVFGQYFHHRDWDFAYEYFRQSYGNLKTMTDKEQIQKLLVTIQYLSRRGIWSEDLASEHRIFDLSYSKEDIGKSFSKEMLFAKGERYSYNRYLLDDIYPVRRMESGYVAIFGDKLWFLIDKEGTIQSVDKDYNKIQGIVLANQINEVVKVLGDIHRGQDVDLELKFKTLCDAWNFCSDNFIKKDEESDRLVIKAGRNEYIKFSYVEKYLSREAKALLNSRNKPKERLKYDDIIANMWAHSIEHEFDRLALVDVDNFWNSREIKNERRIEQLEKIAKAYKGHNHYLVLEISLKKLSLHLENGGHLDNFEFPFKEECKAPCRDFNHLWKIYYLFEMLKKNPQIDLSQIDMKEKDLVTAISEFEYKFKSYLTPNHFQQVKQRIQDNINNPENWGDDSVKDGMYDASFKERFLRIANKISRRVSDREKLQDIALHFYSIAPINDKINYFSQAIDRTIDRAAKKDINDAVKEKIWNVIKKDFENKNDELEHRIELFNQLVKNNLFDETKIHYFEILVGQDGKGGLLKELETAPEPKFGLYVELLNSEIRIPDPEIRSKVVSLAVKQFCKEKNNYNDMAASENERQNFIRSFEFFKKYELSTIHEIDKHQFLRELAELTLSQEKLSSLIKPNPPKIDTQNKKLIASAYGFEAISYLMQNGAIKQSTVIEYLLGNGSDKSTMDTFNTLDNDISTYFSKGLNDKASQYVNMVTPQHLKLVKKEFDAASLEGKAAIINLIKSDNTWEQQFDMVAKNLFKNAGELGEVGRKFLYNYISSRPMSERCFYLSAMYVAANNNITRFDDKNNPYTIEQRSLAQGLRLFLENSGPAGVKLAQAMSSYNGVPNYIRDEMQKAKNNANPPARWEVFDWLESSNEKLCGKLGKLLGSASFFATYEMKGDDGLDKVVKIMRRGSKDMADAEFKIYKEMIGKMKKEFPWIASFGRLIENAASMVDVETNLDIGRQQLKDAKELYPNSAEADGIKFNFKVINWGTCSQNWAEMERAQGKDFKDLEQPYKKAVAKAIFTTELANMLSGNRFDSDRHAGQYKIDDKTNTIGIFDTGSMSITEPTEKEKSVLGKVLAETVKTLTEKTDHNIGAVLCTEIDKGIEKYYKEEIAQGKSIPPYLSEFQRGLLALTDFHQEIPAGELRFCLIQALNNGKHKLDHDIYQGFVSGLSGGEKKEISLNVINTVGGIVVDSIVSLNHEKEMVKEAKLAQEYGKKVFKKILKDKNGYLILTQLSQKTETEGIVDVLSTSIGQIHFAKGMMKGCFSHIDPRLYSSEDKQQLGEILYQVMEKSARLKKLKKTVPISQIFIETAQNFETLGKYAENVIAVVQITDKFAIDSSVFKNAIIFGRLIDDDVQKGYTAALRKSPETNFIRRALSRISPLSLIPRKAKRQSVKFMMKNVAPLCIKTITYLGKTAKNKDKTR